MMKNRATRMITNKVTKTKTTKTLMKTVAAAPIVTTTVTKY